jgi:hypothetical protein
MGWVDRRSVSEREMRESGREIQKGGEGEIKEGTVRALTNSNSSKY